MSLQINLLNWLKSKFNTKEEITSYLNNKVDKVSGKSLVANTEITRLGGMETGANKITAGTGLTKSGTALGISNGGVTATQLDSNSVTTAKITNANVTTDKLADGAVTNAKIGDSQVNNAKLSNNAVTTDKIANSSVTTAKIEDKTIINGDIADNTISSAKIANVSADKIIYTKELTSSDNLDNLTTTGRYWCQSAVMPTISNNKLTTGGIVEVIRWDSNENIISQRVFSLPNSEEHKIYYRIKHTSGWKSWKEVSVGGHTHNETELTWDGVTVNKIPPLSQASIDEFSANRLAYFPPANISIRYSTDNGSTYNNYGADNAQKANLVNKNYDFYLGKGDTTDYSKNRLIIDLNMGNLNEDSVLYCNPQKLLIEMGTMGATGCKVAVHVLTYSNEWVGIGTYDLGGWTGWNAIPLTKVLGGYASQTTSSSTNGKMVRLTFTQTGGTANSKICGLRLIAPKLYKYPSNMSLRGHLYDYDYQQNAIFPAKIIKSGGTSSEVLKANGDVGTVVNDLTTGGTGNVLSAEQGKTLNTNKVNIAQGAGNANKTLSTDSSGNVVVEAKNNHTHGFGSISLETLGAGANFNNYKTQAFIKISYSDAQSATNMPVKMGGLLIVRDIYNGVSQTFQQYGGSGQTNMWYRTYYASDGSWSNWQKIVFDGHTHTLSQITNPSHAVDSSQYGLGTTGVYGHCKTINGLSSTSYEDGEALSAKQGNVLKGYIDNNRQYYITLGNSSSTVYSDPFNFSIARGSSFYANVKDGYGNYATGKVYIEISNTLYSRSLTNGQASFQISSTFNTGTYIVKLYYIDTSNGRFLASASFKLTVT